MSFVWPEALWLLLAVPALVGLYVLLLRRKSRQAMRYASLTLMREAQAGHRRYRRHLPPLLFLLAMIALVVAIARPRATVTLPSEQRTIIMAMDVSFSMRATDVAPSRIAAAREAAKAFVQDQPPDVRIGIVAFAAQASWCSSRRATARSSSPPSTGCSCNTTRRSAARSSCRSLRCSPTRAWHSRRRPTAWGRRANARARRSDRPSEIAREKGIDAGAAGLVSQRGDHPADRRPAHHRSRSARRLTARGGARRQGLHGGLRHFGRRVGQCRRHVDLHALRRGNAARRSRGSPAPSTFTPEQPQT